MKRQYAFFAAILAAATPAFAADDAASAETIRIADDYLAVYSSFDVTKLAPFYADDAVFYDPTSVGQVPGEGPFIFEGKEAILKNLGAYAAGYRSFSVAYDLERRYESAGVVVYVANLSYKGETKDGQAFTGANPIVTVIEVKNGKVARHSDFFDYKSNSVDYRSNPSGTAE